MIYKTAEYKQRMIQERINKKNQEKFENSTEPISPRYFANNSGCLDRNVEKNDIKEKICEFLKILEAKKGMKYRIALEQIYLQGRTLKAVGKMLHFSNSRIGQLNQISFRLIRQWSKINHLERYVIQEKI